MTRILLFSAASVSVVQFRLDFVRELARRGIRVTVLAPVDAPDHPARIAAAGAEFLPFPFNRTGMNPLHDWQLVRRLRRFWREREFDHVIAYAHKPVLYTLLTAARDRPGRRWGLLSGLGYAYTGDDWKRRLARLVFRALYPVALRNCSGMMFLNPDDPGTLAAAGVSTRRVPVQVLRGEGVCLEDFPVAALPAGPAPRFLMIARLLADKGVREFAAAAGALAAEKTGAGFELVGPLDPNPAAVAAGEVEGWQRSGVLRYHGATADVRPFLRACTVYVLPSYREGTPRTVLEAMATGRAIVTSDAPGCRETVFEAGPADADGVRQGRNGLLVPPRSAAALAAALRRFVADPGLAPRLGRESALLAAEHYDVRKVNGAILRFIGVDR